MLRNKLEIKTTGEKEIIDVTDKVNELLSKHPKEKSWVSIFLTNSTAALATSALNPKTDMDVLESVEMEIPSKYSHITHKTIPDHVIASFLGSSLVIPAENGKLLLGDMQRIVLIEFNGPRERTLIVDEGR